MFDTYIILGQTSFKNNSFMIYPNLLQYQLFVDIFDDVESL